MNFYRQCKLKKGTTHTTSWIPEEFAKTGKNIRLRQPNKEWDRGWQVESVGGRMEEKMLRERSQDYKNARKASDI